MKVLLINPPIATPDPGDISINFPTGLGYIASVLEQNNVEVLVLDALIEGVDQCNESEDGLYLVGCDFTEIRKKIIGIKPDVVGISSMFTSQFFIVKRIASVVKSISDKILVAVGGAHATLNNRNIIWCPFIDFVVKGEGEETFIKLLHCLENGGTISKIKGITYLGKNSGLIDNELPDMVDVDSLPFPAWHLFRMEKYITAIARHGKKLLQSSNCRTMSVLTSRGCPYNCNFCSACKLFGKKFRFRSAESVNKEIDYLVEAYQINDLFFNDDQFLGNRKRAVDILNYLNKNHLLTLDAPNGISPWLLDESMIRKLKQAGFQRISLAVESGSQFVLDKIIQKPVNLSKIPEIIELLKKYHLEIIVFLVVGNVGKNDIETIEQIKQSFDLIDKLGITNVNVSYLTPHLGTEVLKHVKKKSPDFVASKNSFYYNKPHFSTSLWNKDELEALVEIETRIAIRQNIWAFRQLKKLLRASHLFLPYRCLYFCMNLLKKLLVFCKDIFDDCKRPQGK